MSVNIIQMLCFTMKQSFLMIMDTPSSLGTKIELSPIKSLENSPNNSPSLSPDVIYICTHWKKYKVKSVKFNIECLHPYSLYKGDDFGIFFSKEISYRKMATCNFPEFLSCRNQRKQRLQRP